MNLLVLILVGAAASFLLSRVVLGSLTRRAVGRAAPDTRVVDGAASGCERRVYGFHAPHCGPCRAMMPVVERLRQSHPNLLSIDVSRDTELARGFGVVATPSIAVVEGGVVREVRVGAQREAELLRLLGGARAGEP